MLKRGLSIFLICLMVLSMAGCGGAAPETAPTTAPAVQAEVPETTQATETSTEPTLSAEEILINSLPEKVRQAYDLGLVELELLEDLDRICLGAEAAKIIQNIHVAHHGVESKIMNQLLEHEHASLEVNRYWLAQVMFSAEAEFIEEAPHEDYLENIKYMAKAVDADMGRNDLWAYFSNCDGATVQINNDTGWISYRDSEPDSIIASGLAKMPDWEEVFWSKKLADQQELYINCTDKYPTPTFWAVNAYDRLTGEKIITANKDTPLLPRQKMTVQEVVETTLRYHNWIPPVPEMLPYEEIPTYDTAIITDDLLTKETNLPEASCQNLPASWKGISSTTLTNYEYSAALTDHLLQENEIQVIADAGFNFLQLHLDFRYYTSALHDIFFWPTTPVEGHMNESRLKELDQIIAWCMERDIHVNLICDKVSGWENDIDPRRILKDKKNITPISEQWTVLARRYADIPNTYLSFTLHDEISAREKGVYGAFFTPVVEAIRAVSPDRCIIAEMADRGDPGEDMAALGVALSTHAAWPEEFQIDEKPKVRKKLLSSAAWPYTKKGVTYDAEGAMTNKQYHYDSPDEVAAVAEKYGVGFMVSGWAPTCKNTPVLPERFSDEFMESYLTDFSQVLSGRGYGWCYGDTNGFVGLFGSYPAVKDSTYTQVDNAPLYIDDEMFGWFKTINGTA